MAKAPEAIVADRLRVMAHLVRLGAKELADFLAKVRYGTAADPEEILLEAAGMLDDILKVRPDLPTVPSRPP